MPFLFNKQRFASPLFDFQRLPFFASRGAKRKRNTTNKKGASGKTSQPKTSAGNRVSATLVQFRPIATLAVAAAFVYALYWLASIDSTTTANKPTKQNTSNYEASNRGAAYEEYTFYKRLRDFSVEVPDAKPSFGNREVTKTLYLIQTGSFKTRGRAERQKAELSLLGLEPTIKDHINSNGNRWYRVTVGPYASRSKMASARNSIISNGLEASVLKRKL